jgi:hypothetical protein
MESLLWSFRTQDAFTLAWPVVLGLFICVGWANHDVLVLLFARFAQLALGKDDTFVRLGKNERPSALIIIPSLLRDKGDLNAFTTTLESCGTNGYPSELVIIACVDGLTEQPGLVQELRSWVKAQKYPDNVSIYVCGTQTRLGKMMAVEAGVQKMHQLVAEKKHAEFPKIYFSIDGDGTLSNSALERLVAKLCKPHPLTGNMRRVVSGKISIRPDLLWQGWKKFFSIEGQIFIQVAREFVVSNMSRANHKLAQPAIGIPGALYCTWSSVIRTAPHFMGFMKSIKFKDKINWWLGKGPPLYSSKPETEWPSSPEALTGASDDTCIAFIASIAHWMPDGTLSFDAPATPLHAIGRFLRAMFWERSHDYEPEAAVYTYTPTSIVGLWKQRVRWNSSRFECGGRFWRAFWFHWEIGLPVIIQLTQIISSVIGMTTYYLLLPYFCFKQGNPLVAYLLGYTCQTIAYSLYTVIGLLLERERRSFWRVLFCLPVASLYCIGINFFGCAFGVTRDLLLFGNKTNFAPEWTLSKSGCQRVALGFRLHRFFSLALRSVIHGDVPLGLFWLGWTENKWAPSGFEGWTTNKRPRSIVGLPSLASLFSSFSSSKPALAIPAVVANVVAPPPPPALAPAPVLATAAVPVPLPVPVPVALPAFVVAAPRVRLSLVPRPVDAPAIAARTSRRPPANRPSLLPPTPGIQRAA